MPNTNFDALLTTTLHNYVSKKLEDNIFINCPTLNAIRAKGGFATKGGDKLLMPLLYAKNTTVKSMTPYGVFDTTPMEGITAAEYLWANLGGTVVLDNFTIDVQNAGEAQVIDLLEAKINQLEASMVDLLNTQLWTTRPLVGGEYRLWSMQDVCFGAMAADDIYADPVYVADGVGYGRISIVAGLGLAGLNGWWRPTTYYETGISYPRRDIYAGTMPLPTTDHTLSIDNLNHIYNMCSNGADTPNLIIMPMDNYEFFETLLVATNRSGPDSALYDAGIEHLKLKNAAVMFDPMCPANSVYFLNTKYLKFVQCRGRNMQSTPFQTPHNQDVRVSKIIWSGQLGCSNRARQGAWVGCHPHA